MLPENVIDYVQFLSRQVAGIQVAPELKKYPGSLSSLTLPIALSELQEPSSFSIDEGDRTMTMSVLTSVYVYPFAQSYLGEIKSRIHRLIGHFRLIYLEPQSFKFDHVSVKSLMLESCSQIILNQRQPPSFSGHQILEYPLGSEALYHGFTIQIGVLAEDDA